VLAVRGITAGLKGGAEMDKNTKTLLASLAVLVAATSTANFGAAATSNAKIRRYVTLSGFTKTATRAMCGATCFSIPSNFALKLGSITAKLVKLPPGWARLCTKPSPTGSPLAIKMTGTGSGRLLR